MHRLLAAVACAALLASGCGSGGDASSGSSASASPSPTATPSAAYFVKADTAAINEAAHAAQAAGTKATARPSMNRCDRAGAKGYAAWRACWHGLLDPYQHSLEGLSTTLEALTGHDVPHACKTQLGHASDTFAGRADEVAGLTKGIDSDTRAQQVKAMHDYEKTLTAISYGYTKPFQALTQVCYSPQDLASINASPSGSPSS